jgi:predicted HTH transcriptional regulator
MLKTKHSSRPANPLLARPMYLYGSIEQVGTGTEMIVEKCIEQGLRAPDFIQDGNFIVTLWRNNENVTEKGTEKIPKNQQLILDNLAQNPNITIQELKVIVGIAASKIKENLSKLKVQGLIERIGPDKGGYWKVHG